MSETPNLDAMRAKTREQDEAATPGPWEYCEWDDDIHFHRPDDGFPKDYCRPRDLIAHSEADAALIAAFRTDAPRYAAMLGVAATLFRLGANSTRGLSMSDCEVVLAKIEEMAR